MKNTCIQCGKEFDLSEKEISYYKSKNLEIPKRCSSCRRANRIKNNVPVAERRRFISNQNGRPKLGFGGNSMTGIIMILIIVVAVVFNGHFRGGSNKDTTTQNPVETTAENGTAGSGVTNNSGNIAQESLTFRNWDLLQQHFEKHGAEVNCSTPEEYLAAANAVVANRKSLHKTEKEDGDDVYFLESTGEFVIVSTDGYIRTYFKPSDGIKYYNRQ